MNTYVSATIIIIFAAVAGVVWLVFGTLQPTQNQATTTNQQAAAKQEVNMTATIKTTKGDIDIAFFADSAPNTVDNFRSLAEDDFYQDIIFHRVIEGFMIQTGDPTGTGRGGPGYTFADELDPDSAAAERGYKRGTVAMANSGPDTNGSQFFIMHQDYNLPYNYTIFGYVTDGMEIVDKIATTPTDNQDKPTEEIVIEDVVISE